MKADVYRTANRISGPGRMLDLTPLTFTLRSRHLSQALSEVAVAPVVAEDAFEVEDASWAILGKKQRDQPSKSGRASSSKSGRF